MRPNEFAVFIQFITVSFSVSLQKSSAKIAKNGQPTVTHGQNDADVGTKKKINGPKKKETGKNQIKMAPLPFCRHKCLTQIACMCVCVCYAKVTR